MIAKNKKNTLAQNGFTFEYYGTIEKGNSYYNNVQVGSSYSGIFCYWNGNENEQARFRFGMRDDYFKENKKLCFVWNAGTSYAGENYSDFSEPGFPWNIWYPTDNKYKDEMYYTITLDTTNSYEENGEEYYKQTIYSNGEILYEGNFNKKQWDYFINNDLKSLNCFCIGRSSMSNDGWWHYSKMNVYTLRLYNHALSSDEVKENYQKSVAYHENL